MEDELFERDYTKTEPNYNYYTHVPDGYAYFKLPFFKEVQAYVDSLPKYIIQKDKENYEYLLKKCDEMAKTWHGKIYGIVDYHRFQSQIRLTLPFVEFSTDEELAFLKDIAERSRMVCFTAKDEKSVELMILIEYFQDMDESSPPPPKGTQLFFAPPNINKQ